MAGLSGAWLKLRAPFGTPAASRATLGKMTSLALRLAKLGAPPERGGLALAATPTLTLRCGVQIRDLRFGAQPYAQAPESAEAAPRTPRDQLERGCRENPEAPCPQPDQAL